MELRPRPLGGNALVQGWLEGDPDAVRYFPSAPPIGEAGLEAFAEKLGEVETRFDREARERVARILGGDDFSDDPRLVRFLEEEGVVVTTGQQPGLFGGPLYGLYKACTVAALARELEPHLGRPVLPVFWVASEDHDWDEVRSIRALDPDNELREVALPPHPEGAPHPPLHRIVAGDQLRRAVDAFLELHPTTDFSDRWTSGLREAYRDCRTLPDGYQAALEGWTGERGVYFLQAHHPLLKERSSALLLRELDEAREREGALQSHSADLEESRFPLQVPILEGGTPLFLDGPLGRERLFLEGDGFRLRRSGTTLTPDEVRSRASQTPGALSPNVLLRPVVESLVLPTLAYVAGPGEAAYFPQTAPLFRAHGIGSPLVYPRLGVEVIEAKVGKVLEKFDLAPEELAIPHHELAGRLTREELPEGIRQSLGSLRGSVAKGAKELEREVAGLDPTLKGPVEHFRNQGFSLLSDVEKKVVQSLKRENEIALAQVEKAQLHLYPLGRPQERVLNALYYLVRYGDAFLDGVGTLAVDHVRGSNPK